MIGPSQSQFSSSQSAALELLGQLKSSSGQALSVEQFSQLLSRTAFELRKNGMKFELNNGKGENGRKADAIWRRALLLVQFGLVDDPRLPLWLAEMGHCLLEGGRGGLAKLVERLEQTCLALNGHFLPPICTPKPPFLACHRAKSASKQMPRFRASAKAAARVDIAGGWTDTPPITYQMGPAEVPAVLSMSIRVNGTLPIRCQCSRLEQFQGIFYREKSAGEQQRTLHFPSPSEVFANSNRPSEPGSLICAVLVIAGMVGERLEGGERRQFFHFGGPGRGILVEIDSQLPHGSGLGSSSILSGALLATLARLRGTQIGHSELVHAVLQVEQLHSTGGGWQDQLGGCVPGGAKLGWVDPVGARECRWRSVPLGGELREKLAKRLVLIYTGRTRLAKTLLQEVLLGWARADPDILETVKQLTNGAREAEKLLLQGIFPVKQCAEYNELKKRFAHNTEPSIVTEFKAELKQRGLAELGWMAGAGGGGFLYVWLCEGVEPKEVEQILEGDSRWHGMSLWRVELEEEKPLEVE